MIVVSTIVKRTNIILRIRKVQLSVKLCEICRVCTYPRPVAIVMIDDAASGTDPLPLWDERGDLTWSVVGGSREVASGILNRTAGFYDEAVLGRDGSRRMLRFPNFDVDAESRVASATAATVRGTLQSRRATTAYVWWCCWCACRRFG